VNGDLSLTHRLVFSTSIVVGLFEDAGLLRRGLVGMSFECDPSGCKIIKRY
jgi:hypothetical protein